jgi:hypothetical protein
MVTVGSYPNLQAGKHESSKTIASLEITKGSSF